MYKRTDVSLPEQVGLTIGRVSAAKFPINLIFDVTHSYESRDNTSPSTCLHW
jgi:hypothetical protein